MAMVTEKAVSDQAPITRGQLVQAFEQFRDVVSAWDENNDKRLWVTWRGNPTKTISQNLEEQIAELNQFIAHKNFQKEAWGLVLAIEEFIYAVVDWADRLNRNPGKTNPQGGREVWGPYEMIDRAMIPPKFGKVESIRQLMNEKVERKQICKIWGFIDEFGNPEFEKLEDEIDNPGIHTKGWEHPDKIRYWADMEARWLERCEDFESANIEEAFSDDQDHRDGWAEPEEAPESLAELLVLEGITLEQIARMKNISIEEVRRAAVDLRIPVDASIAADIANINMEDRSNRIRSVTDQAKIAADIERDTQMLVAQMQTYRDLVGFPARILAMNDDGHNAGLIVRALRDEKPDLTYEQVQKIIRDRDLIIDSAMTDKMVREAERKQLADMKKNRQGENSNEVQSEGQAAATETTQEIPIDTRPKKTKPAKKKPVTNSESGQGPSLIDEL